MNSVHSLVFPPLRISVPCLGWQHQCFVSTLVSGHKEIEILGHDSKTILLVTQWLQHLRSSLKLLRF
uniref:Uncharacterized protein n=1 Tax=Kalanchoe fedtschenkoi TaxID=63787 RepID=A0A7N0UI16_KALFE